MERQAKIDFYQDLDDDVLIEMDKRCHTFEKELVASLKRVREEKRLVNLVIKARGKGIC